MYNVFSYKISRIFFLVDCEIEIFEKRKRGKNELIFLYGDRIRICNGNIIINMRKN